MRPRRLRLLLVLLEPFGPGDRLLPLQEEGGFLSSASFLPCYAATKRRREVASEEGGIRLRRVDPPRMHFGSGTTGGVAPTANTRRAVIKKIGSM